MKRIRKGKKRKAESSRTEPPQFDLGNYPPGELPKYSQKEIRTITLKPQMSESDVAALRYEEGRSQSKKGYFKNSTREDADPREQSADATHAIIHPVINRLAHGGAVIERARGADGRTTGEIRRAVGERSRIDVLKEHAPLNSLGTPRAEIASKIKNRLGHKLSSSQIRRILAAGKSAHELAARTIRLRAQRRIPTRRAFLIRARGTAPSRSR